MLQDVVSLWTLTASDRSRGSNRLRHRLVQRLRAIESYQVAAVGAESAAPQVGKEALTHRRILRRAVQDAERLSAQLPAQSLSQEPLASARFVVSSAQPKA
jgi:hypothetical protein